MNGPPSATTGTARSRGGSVGGSIRRAVRWPWRGSRAPGDPPPVAAPVTRLQASFQLKALVRVGDRGRLPQARLGADGLPLGLDGLSARGWSKAAGRSIGWMSTIGWSFPVTGTRRSGGFSAETRSGRSSAARRAAGEDGASAEADGPGGSPCGPAVAGGSDPYAGAARGRYKMKKPCPFHLTEAPFSYPLKEASIQSAEALEGV